MNQTQESDLWSHHLHVALPKPEGVVEKSSKSVIQDGSHFIYFCDWYPNLFGIDEDEIPPSEDEEGRFEIMVEDLEGLNNLEDIAKALTKEKLDKMRVGPYVCMTDDELREVWLRQQNPKYGRRARPKPMLQKETGEMYECTCDIDYHFCRHYIRKFGKPKKGEELRIPHFHSFREERLEKKTEDLEKVKKILDPESSASQKKLSRRPFPKFPKPLKKSIQNFKKELLSTFRPLECIEIRRYRMPYVEALYLELQEEDCLNAAAFFKHLIVKDFFMHKSRNAKSDMCLRDNRILSSKIFEILKLAEKLNKREDYHQETYVYLHTGRFFFKNGRQFWWLTEEFYAKAVKVSKNCIIDGGKAEAVSNYIYGTFLLDCVHRVNPAQEHLLKARELSQGKEWNASSILKQPQDSVYKETAVYLCRALIATSKELREGDKPEEALPLIYRSYKLCEEVSSWRSDIMMEMYFELGLTYQAVGMFDWATVAFRKFIDMAEMQNYVKGICDGYLELAICCRSEGDMNLCERNLTSFRNTAKIKENENLIAFGDRYLGELHLNNGNPKLAAEFFTNAFTSFLSQFDKCAKIPFSEWQDEHFTLSDDVELTRVLTGVAKGEIIKQSICSLITSAEDSHEKNLFLIEWKNNPDKFTPRELVAKTDELLHKPQESSSYLKTPRKDSSVSRKAESDLFL